MRSFIIVSAFVVLCCTVQAQNLDHFGLKGEVKCVKDEYYQCSESQLKKSKDPKDCFSLQSEMEFTKDGFYIDNENKLLDDGFTRKKEKIATGYLETVFKEEDGVKRNWSENYYDKQNVINKTISYNEEGDVFIVTNYFYNENGKKTKMIRELKFKDKEQTAISYFDEYGTFNAAEMYENDELISREEFVLEYKFDEKGNWIYNSVATDFGTSFVTREIAYY